MNNEGKSTIQVIDVKTMKAIKSWPLSPCEGPTGIAYDKSNNRVIAGCGKTSVVLDGTSGKIVATIANGDGVDALGWDPSQKLIYIPAGRDSNVTVVHQDSPDKYTVVATVPTMRGAKTIAVDPVKHVAYLFQPEYGPAPPNAPPGPGGRPARGPVIGELVLRDHALTRAHESCSVSPASSFLLRPIAYRSAVMHASTHALPARYPAVTSLR